MSVLEQLAELPDWSCETCGSPSIIPHCTVDQSYTCDLVRCSICNSYGIPGQRWAPSEGSNA